MKFLEELLMFLGEIYASYINLWINLAKFIGISNDYIDIFVAYIHLFLPSALLAYIYYRRFSYIFQNLTFYLSTLISSFFLANCM